MSGLELLGGVSAAFGLAQTGFSLAKAIRESAKDYKDARDDIAGLARVIESTISRVAEVEGLINDNYKIKVFSDNGLNTIKNSFLDLERIVRDLIKLLTIAGVPEDTRKTIRPEDVAVTRFQKLSWISLKSEVKDKKDELSNIQIDLTLAIICAQARSSVSPTVIAALRLRVVDLETQRRQYVLNGSSHIAGKPNMLHSTTNDLNSNSNTPIPPVAGEPSTSSAANSVPGVVFVPSGDGGVSPGTDDKPITANQTPVIDMQQGAPQQIAGSSGQQQSTETGHLPEEGEQQQPGKDEGKASQSAFNEPDRVRYAYLLVVDGMEVLVTPLLPPKHPKRLSQTKPRVTAQVWAAFTPNIRREIARSLKHSFPLPRGHGWHLAFARDAATPPYWKRILARVLHLYEEQDPQQPGRGGSRCYMVLFASSRMFDEESVSEVHSPQVPVAIYNHMHNDGDTASTSSSGSTSQVGKVKHTGTTTWPATVVRDRPLHVGLTKGLSKMTVASAIPRRGRSNVSSTSGQSRRSRDHRHVSSSSGERSRSRSRVRRRELERLEHERREFVEETRKLREEIQLQNRARSAIEGQYQHYGYDERRQPQREVTRKQAIEEHHLEQRESSKKNMGEETRRTMEMLERQKREEAEEERRVMEKIERRKFEAKEKERLQWAKFEEMKAKEAEEKKEAEQKIENALRQRLVEADLSPTEIEKIMNKDATERKQQQHSISVPIMAERTPEEETQLFNDAMLRFTGRML